ncbi:caffeoylshikimate esterase [Canna indica]|uniref:Caffeoylshikimate esterase n=1 Tax=Canna indica TaxID=4628 RepID=A0AAQ3JTJ7_9LILI|nr:caffeoylshikimate esterase [Canna indica]
MGGKYEWDYTWASSAEFFRSDGRGGHVPSIGHVINNCARHFDSVLSTLPRLSAFLYGESLGDPGVPPSKDAVERVGPARRHVRRLRQVQAAMAAGGTGGVAVEGRGDGVAGKEVVQGEMVRELMRRNRRQRRRKRTSSPGSSSRCRTS